MKGKADPSLFGQVISESKEGIPRKTISHLVPLFLLVSFVVLTSCSEPSTKQQVKYYARQDDIVYLCDIVITNGRVRYVAKQLLSPTIVTNVPRRTKLPVSGPAVEPGTRYGDEAIVFVSSQGGHSADYVLILHSGMTADGSLSRETLIRMVQEEQKGR